MSINQIFCNGKKVGKIIQNVTIYLNDPFDNTEQFDNVWRYFLQYHEYLAIIKRIKIETNT